MGYWKMMSTFKILESGSQGYINTNVKKTIFYFKIMRYSKKKDELFEIFKIIFIINIKNRNMSTLSSIT